jgi:hypothetical protein
MLLNSTTISTHAITAQNVSVSSIFWFTSLIYWSNWSWIFVNSPNDNLATSWCRTLSAGFDGRSSSSPKRPLRRRQSDVEPVVRTTSYCGPTWSNGAPPGGCQWTPGYDCTTHRSRLWSRLLRQGEFHWRYLIFDGICWMLLTDSGKLIVPYTDTVTSLHSSNFRACFSMLTCTW